MSVALGSGIALLLPISQPRAAASTAMAMASTARLSLLCHQGRLNGGVGVARGIGSRGLDRVDPSAQLGIWAPVSRVAWSPIGPTIASIVPEPIRATTTESINWPSVASTHDGEASW